MLLPLAFGAGIGVLNTIASSEARAAEADKLRRVIAQLEEMKYTSFEKEQRLDTIADYYNTSILDEQNSAAIGIGLGGYVNPEVLKLALNTQMLGQRSKALSDESARIDEYNRGVEGQQAQVEAGMPTGSPIMDFLGGAAEGVGLGLQVENALKTFELMDKQMEAFDDYLSKENTASNDFNISTQQSVLGLRKFEGVSLPRVEPLTPYDINEVIEGVPTVPTTSTPTVSGTPTLKPVEMNFEDINFNWGAKSFGKAWGL